MIKYITFNDNLSGIYESQVIDVINFLNDRFKTDVRLVAFVPWGVYKTSKKKLKLKCPNASVYPILFGVTRWQLNRFLLKLVSQKNSIAIARGPLAFDLAYGSFKKVIYDGRAAVKAEVEEYDVTGSEQLNEDFKNAEKLAVTKANYRIAVSDQLVKYWQKEYKYSKKDHVIIPCTLNQKVTREKVVADQRNRVKMVYSGGTSGWQSFELVVKLVRKVLNTQNNIDVLFLTKEVQEIEKLISDYPDRCERKWLNHDEVAIELGKCDYGILIREDKITNRVASPVKFAEYLNSGLSVLISSSLGDFTQFVEYNNCGLVVSEEIPPLEALSLERKSKNQKLCEEFFYKSSPLIVQSYSQLVQQLR